MRKESKNYETSVYKDIIEKPPKEMANIGGAYVTYFAAFTAVSNKTSVSTSYLPIPETDRQADRQTGRQTDKKPFIHHLSSSVDFFLLGPFTSELVLVETCFRPLIIHNRMGV